MEGSSEGAGSRRNGSDAGGSAHAAQRQFGRRNTKESAALALPRSRHAGSFLRGRAAGLRNHQRQARRPEARCRIHAGARQGRQRTRSAAGEIGARRADGVSSAVTPDARGREAKRSVEWNIGNHRSIRSEFTSVVHRARRTQADAPADVADGASGLGGFRARCLSAHAAPFLRHAHGGERRRSAHRADDSRPR